MGIKLSLKEKITLYLRVIKNIFLILPFKEILLYMVSVILAMLVLNMADSYKEKIMNLDVASIAAALGFGIGFYVILRWGVYDFIILDTLYPKFRKILIEERIKLEKEVVENVDKTLLGTEKKQYSKRN